MSRAILLSEVLESSGESIENSLKGEAFLFAAVDGKANEQAQGQGWPCPGGWIEQGLEGNG
jgi:hypothetical protein